MSRSVTITSASVSPVLNLDSQGAKYTSFAVTSSAAFAGVIEATLDSLASSPTWFAMSSALTASSSIMLYTGPLSGLRLNASAVTAGAPVTLAVLQGVGW